MSLSDRVRGARAKSQGLLFERILAVTCQKEKIHFEQLPSGCRWVGKVAIPARSPFDFIMAKGGRAGFFDAKSIDSETFSHSMLKSHQVEALYALEMSGLTAGYIVWLRKSDQVVFFKASLLKALSSGCSLKVHDGIMLGSSAGLRLGELLNG